MGQPQRHTNLGWQCEVEGCDEEAVAVGLCHNCYQAEQRWAARTPAERRHRRQQLAKWQARMERLQVPRLRSV